MRYRVERQEPGKNFMALHPGLIEVQEYLDTAPVNGSTYRLFAVNGLGEEISLGETTSGPTLGAGSVLAVRPNPAPGGKTTIMYRSLGQLPVTVEIFDMAGRRVRSVFQGIASGPEDSVRWDGRNAQGQPVVPGVYFVRISQPGGLKTTSRIVVTP